MQQKLPCRLTTVLHEKHQQFHTSYKLYSSMEISLNSLVMRIENLRACTKCSW